MSPSRSGGPLRATRSNGVIEVGGPEVFGLDEWIRTVLTARSDPREVVTDPLAPYFGAVPGRKSFLPGPDSQVATTTLADWLARDDDR